jgi:hypothetical protein
MLGIVALVLAFLIGIPLFLMSMGVIAGLVGSFLADDAADRYEGSELLNLNK